MKNEASALLSRERENFHKRLLAEVLTVDKDGNPSNADKSARLSVELARGIAERLKAKVGVKLAGQTSGRAFEALTAEFLKATFPALSNLRPGNWEIIHVGNPNRLAIAEYEQYAHLTELQEAARKNPELAAILGSDYTITPDVVIFRNLPDDAEINRDAALVDDRSCLRAALRRKNGGKPLLHASISSKWTIRSDRSQNSRSEALNLIRNRKGHLPHIVVVTGEPMPSRLSSIALGTGDIDCVYHFALHELLESVEEWGAEDAMESLKIMVDGKRLKDISDLPMDLAV
jgi:hypothetical protein